MNKYRLKSRARGLQSLIFRDALDTSRLYSPQEVAEEFIKTTSYWYEDAGNKLYGQKEKSRKLAEKFLETGEEPPDHWIYENLKATRFNMPAWIYVCNKLQNEWIGPNGIFYIVHKESKYRLIDAPFEPSIYAKEDIDVK